MEMPMIRRNRDVSRPNFNQPNPKCANRRASYLKTNLAHALRVMAPALFALTFASVAHAQGTMDFSGAQTLMGTFKTFAVYAGAVICFGGLIFAGIRMMSGRFQFTAPSKELGVANRDLGTVARLEDGQMTLRMDGKSARMVTFETAKFRQFDLGYAVTSHSSQGLTAGRVLVHIDTDSSRSLINNRLAYVSISRASDEARIYTNDAATLGERLSTDVTKKAAVGGTEIPTNVLRSEDFNRKQTPPKILATRTEELGISL
jgi:hypothetical protein